MNSAAKTKRVVTIEELTTVGGLDGIAAEIISQNCNARLDMIGIPDQFTVVGEYDQLIDYYGLSVNSLVDKIEEIVNRT